jgi:hypothetical protein
MITSDFIINWVACVMCFVTGRVFEAQNRKYLNRKNYFLLVSIYTQYHPPRELMTALMATATGFLPPNFQKGLEKQNLPIPEINYLVEFTLSIIKMKLEKRRWWQWQLKREDKLLMYWLETINAHHVLAMNF